MSEITNINARSGHFEFVPDETERLDREFASLLFELDAQPAQNLPADPGFSAEIVDINVARAMTHHPSRKRKSSNRGLSRTNFTRKPIG
jgi:hypothetical protein